MDDQRTPITFISDRYPVHIFRDIEGYEGLYQISQTGKLKSFDRLIERKDGGKYILEGRIIQVANPKDPRKYKGVTLYKEGETKSDSIHRLVASAFVENPDPEVNNIINHMDGVKTNNHYTNLEWCTQSHNLKHAIDMGLHSYPGHDVIVETNIARARNVALYIHGEFIHEARSARLMAEYVLDNYPMIAHCVSLKVAINRCIESGRLYLNKYDFRHTGDNN